jgi:anti-sigma factor RsiW
VRLFATDLVCREAVELMSDYLDGALSRRKRRRLERHLADCDACDGYLEQLRTTISVTGAAAPEDLDPEVLEGLTDLYRQYRGERDDH